MARVFVSHASEDRALADEVHQWLVEAGHEVFLDQDLRDAIAAGQEWEQQLHERLRWANAVVCVVTSAYRDSMWCAVEIGIARSRGSQLLPLCAEPDAAHPLLTSLQHFDYIADLPTTCAAVLKALREVDTTWPDDRSPFPGLRPFDTDQHRVFFGRADEVGQLAELLRSAAERAEGAALLVVGPSGCGKSSLVRAGLLPVLADQPGWRTLPPILPGTDPVAALARELAAAARRIALNWTIDDVHHQLDQGGLAGLVDELLLADPAGPQQRLLIVVDQFEELLTQTVPADRARFTELLRPALTGPVRVVATLRPEFFDQLLVEPALAALPTRTFTLRPLRREALRAVIEKPAQLAGIDVDDGLVDRLVDDTDSGEALPLLAFTLAQLADGVSRGGRLSSTRYNQLGGVQGALTGQADVALTDAIAAGGRSREKVIAGLLRLVTVDEQGRPTRWRVRRDELPAPVVTELDTFVERRLLTTDEGNGSGVLGVAHEAFLSAWPPLAQAITAAASALRARRAIEHAAIEWHDTGRPPSRLWEGGQLAAALTDTGARLHGETAPTQTVPRRGSVRWLPQRHRVLVTDRVDLSTRASDFLHTSIRRDRSRRRRAVTVLSVLLVFALAAAGVAVIQQRSAEDRQLAATARQLVAQAELIQDTDPRTALQLSLAAHRIHPDGQTHASLVSTLTTTTPYAGTLTGHSDEVSSVAFSPDGNTLATASADDTVILWDLTHPIQPQRHGQSLTNHTDSVISVAFSPDGDTLATGSNDDTALLWDITNPAQPRQLGPPLRHTDSVRSVTFSRDGNTLATASDDTTVMLWDITNRAHPQPRGQPLRGHTDSVRSVTFSPDGNTLATGSADMTVILWDLTAPSQPQPRGQPLRGHTDHVFSVALSPDGNTLATGSADDTVRLWDLTNPAQPQPRGQPLTNHTDDVGSVVFAPDRPTLATASDDTTTTLWDLTDPARPRQLRQPLRHTDWVESVAFAANGTTLATGSRDSTAILWDLTNPAQPQPRRQPLTGHTDQVDSVAFAHNGTILATGSADDTAILWDLTDPARPRLLSQPLRHTDDVSSVAFARDGDILATGGDDSTTTLWDISDPTQPRQLGQPLVGHAESVLSVAFDPDGTILATGSDDTTAILWDITDPTQPRQLGQPLRHTDDVRSVTFSPDGDTLATGSAEDEVILWDITDPARPRHRGQPLRGHTNHVLSVAFAPDGTALATGSEDGTVRLWDLADLARPQQRGQPLRNHTNEVKSVAFTPDGTALATGSDDDTAILWDLTDPVQPRVLGRPLTGHTGSVMSVAFSPDGRTLATSSVDDTVTLWDLTNLNDLRNRSVERACALTGGGLDRDQWERYLPGLRYQDTCSA